MLNIFALESRPMKPTMSKQLCLSATAAILSMAVFVLIAGRGGLHADTADQMAAQTPLVSLTVTQ
ncbi:MAG: hypothetical protein ACI8QU_000593 [Devosia litorisediminis]|jgi:hypothetical protein